MFSLVPCLLLVNCFRKLALKSRLHWMVVNGRFHLCFLAVNHFSTWKTFTLIISTLDFITYRRICELKSEFLKRLWVEAWVANKLCLISLHNTRESYYQSFLEKYLKVVHNKCESTTMAKQIKTTLFILWTIIMVINLSTTTSFPTISCGKMPE